MLRLSDKNQQTLRWTFTGPNGIRAGWSLLIYIATFMALGAAITIILRLILGHHEPPKGEVPIVMMLLQEGVSTVIILLATYIMGRIEGRPFWSYGLAPRRAAANWIAGALFGFAALSTLVGVLYAGGFLVFDGVMLHGLSIALNGLVMLFLFFLVGVFEETLFRGYALATLERGLGFWPAAAVSSLLFAAAHIKNDGEGPVGIIQVFVAGMLLCALLRITGSLWLSIGFHTAWDWAQSYLYSTPDSGIMFQGHLLITHAAGNTQFSGGATGPEGSLIATPILIGGLAAMTWLYRNSAKAGTVA